MTYQSALYIVAVFIGLVANGILIVLLSTRKALRVGRLLQAILVMMFILSFCYLMIRVGREESSVYFWSSLRYVCGAVVPALFLLFVLDLTGQLRTLTLRIIAALYVIPVITVIALLTNNDHSLFMTNWHTETIEGLTVVVSSLGDMGVLHTLYTLLIIVISVYFLARGLIKARGLARQQYALLLIGAGCVVAPYFMFVVLKSTPIDAAPIGLSCSAVFIWLALTRRHLFHILPLAHSLIVDSIADAVFVIDENQQVIELNHAAMRLAHCAYSSAIGVKLGALMPALTKDAPPCPEEICLDVDGDARYYEVKHSAINTPGGLQMGKVITLREVTERRDSETRSLELALERERIQLFSRFVRSISHDLRTPLAVMNTSIYIARKSANAEQREEKLAIIEEQIRRMTSMIEDMHLLAKLDSGIALEMSTLRLEDVIYNIPSTVRRLVQDKRLNFQLEGNNLLRVRGQPDLLVRAYHNLLHNAALYTPPEGSVTVRVYASESCGVIAVEDTGGGMTSEQLTAAFEKFQKTNEARTTDGSGLGIGLPIARKIALAHRGTLEARSNPGVGSVFRIVLPLTDSALS